VSCSVVGAEAVSRPRAHLRTVAAIALPTLLLAACGTSTPQAGTERALDGSSWVLSSVTVDQVAVAADAGASSTLVFAPDGQVSGSTGCNRFVGEWQQDGTTLAITAGATTLAACASPALTEQEQRVLEAFAQTEAARQSDETLDLLDGDGAVLATYTESTTDLAGSTWQATGVNNQSGGVESSALTESVTAKFGDDGVLTGFSGCRGYTARYEATGGMIAVTDIAFDGDHCSGAEAVLEQNVAAAFAASRTYAIEGTTLNLRDNDGATQLNLIST
jgi:heat shock protein HslJ